MAGVRDQLLANRELIHNLAVMQRRPLSQVASALEERGVKASVPTLSRFVRDVLAGEAVAAPPSPEPPSAPLQADGLSSAEAAELVTVVDQQLDLLADLGGKIEGNSRTVTELERFLREEAAKPTPLPPELAGLPSAIARQAETIARLESSLRAEAATIADPIDRKQVRRIWLSAFVVTGLVWFLIIVGAGFTARLMLVS